MAGCSPAPVAGGPSSSSVITALTTEKRISAAVELLSQLERLAALLLAQKPTLIKEATHILELSHECLMYIEVTCVAHSLEFGDDYQSPEMLSILNRHAWWVLSCLTLQQVEDLKLVKLMVRLALALAPYFKARNAPSPNVCLEWLDAWEEPPGDQPNHEITTKDMFKPARQLASDIQCILGNISDYFAAPEDHQLDDPTLAVVTPKTTLPIISTLIGWVEEEVSSAEWAISQLRHCYRAEAQHDASDEPSLAFDNSIKIERRISIYLQQVLQVMGDITSIILRDQYAELLIRCHQLCFKTVASLTKSKIATKLLPITDDYVHLLEYACVSLTPTIYDFLSIYQGRRDSDSDDNVGDAAGTRSRINKAKGKGKDRQIKHNKHQAQIGRESRLVPRLIFTLEQFERFVIQLSASSKTQLTRFLRRSTARDFRVDIQRLQDISDSDVSQDRSNTSSHNRSEGDASSGVEVGVSGDDDGGNDQGMSDQHFEVEIEGHGGLEPAYNVAVDDSVEGASEPSGDEYEGLQMAMHRKSRTHSQAAPKEDEINWDVQHSDEDDGDDDASKMLASRCKRRKGQA
ncbi:hypothetical protein EV182_001752 [Spiromyces aspiralis]|uniref:Uncharacterized protein n=1 Tax=Spiromyces aspiralis TaxID=68401 RepID=A0ACC1HIZ1_9FUNG|nr:hypothetical protein EV182_001752 [Spiromyces aspiralis]